MAWATTSDAAVHWADSVSMPPAQVTDLLGAAQEACEEFAPTLATGAPVPARYRVAVVLHAQDLWNATKAAADGGTIGVDPYTVRPRPLSPVVKGLLRPRRWAKVG